MGSSRKRQRTEYFNSVHIIDFNQLLTLKLWETPKDDQARVYLQPSDETETNRDGFMEKFTVGSEIFNLLLLIKNQLVLEDSDQTTAHEIQLSKVESNILTALLNFASFISTNEIELDKFRYLSIT